MIPCCEKPTLIQEASFCVCSACGNIANEDYITFNTFPEGNPTTQSFPNSDLSSSSNTIYIQNRTIALDKYIKDQCHILNIQSFYPQITYAFEQLKGTPRIGYSTTAERSILVCIYLVLSENKIPCSIQQLCNMGSITKPEFHKILTLVKSIGSFPSSKSDPCIHVPRLCALIFKQEDQRFIIQLTNTLINIGMKRGISNGKRSDIFAAGAVSVAYSTVNGKRPTPKIYCLLAQHIQSSIHCVTQRHLELIDVLLSIGIKIPWLKDLTKRKIHTFLKDIVKEIHPGLFDHRTRE